MPEGAARADPGSFRDPTNRVFLDGDRGRVLRGLTDTALDEFEALQATSMYRSRQLDGSLVATRLLDEPPTLDTDTEYTAVLEHERIPVRAYPYEWSFGMLRDAALLQLRLAREALDEGLITKDATPYNVQYVGTRAVHIDIGSFERLTEGQPWYGYRQFCQQLLFPLLITDRLGIPHHQALRGALEGITPEQCAAVLPGRDVMRPSLLAHVYLQARKDRRRTPDHEVTERAELRAAGFGPAVLRAQLDRLLRLVEGLGWDAASSTWSEYSDRAHYDPSELEAKTTFVQRVVSRAPRRQVLDLGANDGHYSRLAAAHAQHVVAVDADPLVVDRLYGSLRQSGDERILPLVVDLTDIPGGLGWRGIERPPITERVAPDVVLCLALIHHLCISGGIPLPEVVDFLASFGADVVLEHPLPEDPKVRVLLDQKKDPALAEGRYQADVLESAVQSHFSVQERLTLGTRVLYHLRPRR